jgi:hypothetical protein
MVLWKDASQGCQHPYTGILGTLGTLYQFSRPRGPRGPLGTVGTLRAISTVFFLFIPPTRLKGAKGANSASTGSWPPSLASLHNTQDGHWKVGAKRMAIYALATFSTHDRIAAARGLT